MIDHDEEKIDIRASINPFSKRPKNTLECFLAFSDSMAECSVAFIFSMFCFIITAITLPFAIAWFVIKDIMKILKK